jgi:hypothetical protein
MNDKIKIVTKRFSDIKKYEIFNLKKLCFTHGVFKILLNNLQKRKIEKPDEIYLTLLKKNNVSHAWLLEDAAGEYDVGMKPGECSIMLFTHPLHRKLGYTSKLIENRLHALSSYSKLSVYSWPDDEVRYFFNRISNKYNLNLEIKYPTFYGEKIK